MERRDLPIVEADVTFLRKEEGGRKDPLDLREGPGYRPHVVIGDPNQRKATVVNGVEAEEYLGVEFCQHGSIIRPGERARVRLRLAFHPALTYAKAVPGATFTIREGANIVAYGAILHRDDT